MGIEDSEGHTGLGIKSTSLLPFYLRKEGSPERSNDSDGVTQHLGGRDRQVQGS